MLDEKGKSKASRGYSPRHASQVGGFLHQIGPGPSQITGFRVCNEVILSTCRAEDEWRLQEAERDRLKRAMEPGGHATCAYERYGISDFS